MAGFDSSTTTALAQPAIILAWKVEARTNFAESTSWTELTLKEDPHIQHTGTNGAADCTLVVVNDNYTLYRDESSKYNYLMLRAEVRVTAIIELTPGGTQQSEVKFAGFIDTKTLTDEEVELKCSDKSILVNEAGCEVSISPTQVEAVPLSSRVPVALIDLANLGQVYGLAYADAPEAFNDANTARRSWVPGISTVWSNASGTDSENKIPFPHYTIDYESGAVSILEPSHAVHNYPGSTSLRIRGDQTVYFISGYKFQLDADGNDGVTYTLSAPSTYDGTTYTTLTFTPSLAATPASPVSRVFRNSYWIDDVRCYLETGGDSGAGANVDLAQVFIQALESSSGEDLGGLGLGSGDYSIPDTGIDVGMQYYYRGRVRDLFEEVGKKFQVNVKYWFEPVTGKHTVAVIAQKDTTHYDWALQGPVKVDQVKSDTDLYTRIEVTGKSEIPINLCGDGTVYDWTTAGDWFKWDGVNAPPDITAAEAIPYLFNGNDQLASGVHNLSSTADLDGTSGNKYKGWYQFCNIDLESVKQLDYVRVVLPPSRNRFADTPDFDYHFWPGIWAQGSSDDVDFASVDPTTWFTLAPGLYGAFKPSSVIELDDTQIAYPRVRHVRVYCKAYKFGFENDADAGIGLGEIMLSDNANYRIIRAITNDSALPDYVLSNGDTISRYYPDLYTRVGYLTRYINLDHQYNECLARDYATIILDESVRLFDVPMWTGVVDPRVRMWQTVLVTDPINLNNDGTANRVTILVESISHEGTTTTIKGTNYLGGALGAS